MAKKSSIEKEKKRQQLVEKYAEERRQLREKGDWASLSRLPKNSNATRLHNRCKITGRSRGYMRRFGLSRIAFREMALQGLIPGVTKSSW
ncbi:MAG: 30S ribosomal protein S14 [Chloroflexi bacterium]|nr:30S ribosomal protein S14 [Chloroflexota bacterium]MDL1885576.1 30S ribosomal protein S14 [Anaerolineae bacterium CFX8]